jgi:hypothetical protein
LKNFSPSGAEARTLQTYPLHKRWRCARLFKVNRHNRERQAGMVRERPAIPDARLDVYHAGARHLRFGVVGVILVEKYHDCRCKHHCHKSQTDQDIDHWRAPLGDALNAPNRIQHVSAATVSKLVQPQWKRNSSLVGGGIPRW